jgi:hypothetical protein
MMITNLLAQLRNPLLPPEIGGGDNPSVDQGASAIGGFVSGIANFLLIVAGVAAFLYLILGGLQWITSGDDKNGMEQARNKIAHAIIGLIIVASSWAIWMLLGTFLGIDFRNLPFPTIG